MSVDVKSAIKTLQQTQKKSSEALASSAVHLANIVRKSAVQSLPAASNSNDHSKPGRHPKVHANKFKNTTRVIKESDRAAYIVSKWYGSVMLEQGSSIMKARPFVAPALERNLSRVPILMRTEFQKAIPKTE